MINHRDTPSGLVSRGELGINWTNSAPVLVNFRHSEKIKLRMRTIVTPTTHSIPTGPELERCNFSSWC